MGARGPVPKRSNQRRRRNKEKEPDKAPAGVQFTARPPKNATRAIWDAYARTLGIDPGLHSTKTALIEAINSAAPKPPEPDDKWHPAAQEWFRSLASSGQSKFYEASDWATAAILAESMSRDLKPQFVGFAEVWNPDAGQMERKPQIIALPLKGASLSSYLKGMSLLLVTEGDRRRLKLELEKPGASPSAVPGVPNLADYRDRLTG